MKVAFHRAKPIDQESLAPAQLKAHLTCEFPELDAVERHRFVMVAELADLIFCSKKSSTIRYSKGAVEYPSAQELPLYVVGDHRQKADPACIGALRIGAVRYKTLAELSEHDAHKDGFASKAELVEALHTFYGNISSTDVLSVFEFTLSGQKKNDSRAAREHSSAA